MRIFIHRGLSRFSRREGCGVANSMFRRENGTVPFALPLSVLFVVFLLTGGLARAEGKFDPAARAKVIAAWIDEQTLAVAHVDLTRVTVEPLLDRIVSLAPWTKEAVTQIKKEVFTLRGQLLRADVRDVYVLFTLTDSLRTASLFAVIPLDSGSDEKAIRAAFLHAAAERRGDVLVLAPRPDTLARLHRMTPDARPELVPALEAAGDTAAQVLLLPPKHYRRVLEEAVGEFPKELGGGSMKILTEGVLWAAVGIDVDSRPALRMVIQSEDARAARGLAPSWAT